MDVVREAVADLARSGISIEDAEAAGIYAVDSAQELHESLLDAPALVLPYLDVSGNPVKRPDNEDYFRVRYLAKPPSPKRLHKTKDVRYGQPSRSGVRAYFPHVEGLKWADIIADTDTPIIITEGEKKALAACLQGLPTIGLGGVFNWLQEKELLPELAEIDWARRPVYICFDSDAVSNSNILTAEARLSTELEITRKAKVYRVRIPAPKDSDTKVGLDDYLVKHKVEKFKALLSKAQPMRPLDHAVLRLNNSIAWIESEGMILEPATQTWIKKDNLIRGSAYSTHKLAIPNLTKSGVKVVSVASEWLQSPLARRYTDTTFIPCGTKEVVEQGKHKLNLWGGYVTQKGSVEPWLRLTRHLMSNLPEEHQDFCTKLMAYKAQNPATKPAVALVFIGPEGCGKSLWARCVREAFEPHSCAVPSAALTASFNPWVEATLVAVIDEAQALHLSKGNDVLKSLISETRTYLNQKYRAARQINSYTLYILTSNHRSVGSFAQNDRRMMVIDAPDPSDHNLYMDVVNWLDSGGNQKLMHWLLEYDLEGWKPPQTAPMTPEKYMAYMESLTPVQRLAEEMRTATQNTIKLWLDSAMDWAAAAELDAQTAQHARTVKEMLGRIQVRPFYTPEELMLIFPAVTGMLHGGPKTRIETPGELSRQLRDAGLTYLKAKDDPRGFLRHGRIQQFLVVCDADEWKAPLTQAEFDETMSQFPEYRNM